MYEEAGKHKICKIKDENLVSGSKDGNYVVKNGG